MSHGSHANQATAVQDSREPNVPNVPGVDHLDTATSDTSNGSPSAHPWAERFNVKRKATLDRFVSGLDSVVLIELVTIYCLEYVASPQT